ncbi:diguanylate cyclase [Actinoplanes couchii]|uniref:Serine/threonine protein kinase n=1 Tax=Actinoplanes couchii TaxID=403638 RepID=A0ABQ3XTN1_9ACTN|nr:diguanylate cyclase [Actinoplanes couchii]MDR6317021.1 diguanylate cyclase (GGDEF)-like protein [Actinoplanes couchii]GID61732.1 hypothetical protein Aco03nite_101360 [Actinoplanes couchii]
MLPRQQALVLRRLAGVPGVPVLPGAEPGEEPLTCPILDPGALLDTAAELTSIVAALHERGVLHKNITPAAVRRTGPRLVLGDFELATTYPLERPRFTHHRDITGTLAYLAPEQTGRTGRPVDQRSDLYSLGATLYEMATGAPPFGAGDPLRLLRDHLTRVPDPIGDLAPGVPAMLGLIVAKLLEKDPESRYQSAEGVLHDLRRLRTDPGAVFPPGERDFPWELTAPSHLVGRSAEAGALDRALAGAIGDGGRVVALGGPPGVGKSALVDGLRPSVARAGGWFVAGRFDPARPGPDADGLRQAFRTLARMLLAEPAADLQRLREHLTGTLGANAGILAAVVPEIATVLGIVPDGTADDPVTVHTRLMRSGLEVLRAVAGPDRPLVMVIDDAHWAQGAAVEFLDGVVGTGGIPGFLLVAAYRDDQLPAAHPLAAALARWRSADPVPAMMTVAPLPATASGTLLREMLRLPVDRYADLLTDVAVRCDGNPFETVERVNALRRGGALRPDGDGWVYDPLRALSVDAGPAALTARLRSLPEAARRLTELLGCLGDDVTTGTLATAAACTEEQAGQRLRPAIEAGLVVADQEWETYGFRNDRIRQAAHDAVPAADRAACHLTTARRLAARPGTEAVVAEQYLLVLDLVEPGAEAAEVTRRLCDAAAHARRTVNFSLADRALLGAARLAAGDPVLLGRIAVERQAALLAMSRFEEAAEIYRGPALDGAEPAQRLAAADLYMTALICQNRFAEALSTGYAALTAQGLSPSVADDETGLMADEMITWAATGSAEDDARRARAHDPLARIIARSVQAAWFLDDPLHPWLIRAAARRWRTEGPSVALAGALVNAHFVLSRHRDDYTTGYDILHRMLRFSEILQAEPDASYIRFLHTVTLAPFFQPFPAVVAAARDVHDRLVRGGDLTNAGFTAPAAATLMIDYAPLAAYRAETDRGLAFAETTRNGPGAQNLEIHRQVAAVLTGDQDRIDEQALAGAVGAAAIANHIYQALVALILGDDPALQRHSARAAAMIPAFSSIPTVFSAHLIRALALAVAGHGDTPEFAAHRDWLTRRAADSPGEFGHLVPWLHAEQARDLTTAVRWYDRAQRAADERDRPWHQAVIAERHGRLLLAYGLTHTAHVVLADAAERYLRWGALRKVTDLRIEFGLAVDDRRDAPEQAAELLAVLRAGQAISSDTGLAGLSGRVGAILTDLTGAETVHLVIHDAEHRDWRLLTPDGVLRHLRGPALVPLTVVRHVEHTRQPLIVTDATRDVRFAADPYLRAVPRCALLVVPVDRGGQPSAVLVLEHRQRPFAGHHQRTVALLTGQLSVSLHNVLLYAGLERQVADRTRELATVNARLAEQAVTDVLTGLPNRRRLATSDGATAAAMIDIDHFKKYNDHYGHQAGDACLREVARAISGAVRIGDVVIRYGGEEFAVLLQDADQEVAILVAERIQAAIRRLGLPHAAAPAGVVTASIGVACSGDASPEKLISRADECLYRSKRDGRDRITSGGMPEPGNTGSRR